LNICLNVHKLQIVYNNIIAALKGRARKALFYGYSM